MLTPAPQHKLDPLLRPRSVAVVGASAREDSMGWWSLENLERGGFAGDIYPVNPGYETLRGRRCYSELDDLPATPDLVIFAVGDHRIEAALDAAIARSVPAAVVMSGLVLDDDSEPRLSERIRKKVRDSGMLVCGANGMGFYNIGEHVWAVGFDSRRHPERGNVTFISHSGSGMCGIVDCEERIRFNLAVSTGNELGVTMDEYLDFALELPETKAVGLFIETARNPHGFRAALDKARHKRIPVIALKVGRTEASAALTVSHSGAMAGEDSTYDALFDYYGVHRVRDMDELATALILFAEMNPLPDGGLVTIHDSGGERQLIVDLADELGVPLTELAPATVRALEKVLDPELPAVNPLDAWSRGGEHAAQTMIDCMSIMLNDRGAAVGGFVFDRAPDGLVYPRYRGYLQRAREASGKPVALVASRQGTGNERQVVEWTHEGLPAVDGVTPFLRSVRGLMNYRDFHKRRPVSAEGIAEGVIRNWARRLAEEATLDEAGSLAMLRDFGIPASEALLAENEDEMLRAAASIGYPLVLKTAMPGILHKTEQRGVCLDIGDGAQLAAAYKDLRKRLGARVLLAPMAYGVAEMFLGARRDPQFGPVVLFGFGGTMAEVLGDVVFALPPFTADYARRRLDGLKLTPLLKGFRGAPPADIDAFCAMAARFSVMVDALRGEIEELDVNPVIVGTDRSIAVEALVVGRANVED